MAFLSRYNGNGNGNVQRATCYVLRYALGPYSSLDLDLDLDLDLIYSALHKMYEYAELVLRAQCSVLTRHDAMG